MHEFIKVRASDRNTKSRRMVCGVGVNDAWYNTGYSKNGKALLCPIYSKWSRMLQRCYSEKCQKKQPSYIGCTVCDEWLSFSSFYLWVSENMVDGWDMDKDIKIKGNKIYSPATCLFVPRCVNTLLLNKKLQMGRYPVGVSFHKPTGKFQVSLSVDGKSTNKGYFNTVDLASNAYAKAKNEEIKRKCEQYPQFANYLINHLLKTNEDSA